MKTGLSRARAPGTAFLVLIACAAPLAAQPGTGVLRVAPTGSNAGGCGAAATPCAHPQRAVNLAVSGDEIRVAAGTYVYDAALDTVCTANLGKTAVVCIVNKELEVRGGYTTADWSAASPDANRTVIDGQNTRRGVLVIDTAAGPPLASLELTGFTVTRGRGLPPTLGAGDALLFAFGGGLQSVLARTVVRSVEFVDNLSIGANSGGEYGGVGAGGGLSLQAAPAGTLLEDVRFEGNVAQGGTGTQRGGYAQGGGLFSFRSNFTATRVEMVGNEARAGSTAGDGTDSTGQSGDGLGGGASLELGTVATLVDWRLRDNLALGGNAGDIAGGLAGDGYGGAIFGEGAAAADATILTVTGLLAEHNRAEGGNARSGGIGGGGAWSSLNVNQTLSRFVLLDNDAAGGDGTSGSRGAAGGGGFKAGRFGTSGVVDLSHGVVAGNASIEGGGTAVSGGGGGGVWLQGVTGEIDHLTVDANSIATVMSGQALLMITGGSGGDVTLSHSTVSGHGGAGPYAVHVLAGNTLRFDGPGLYADNSANSNEGQPGAGTYVDHILMTPVADIQYVAPGPPSFDYHLEPGSPAVGAAPASAATFDYENQSRDASPDIGADELGRPSLIFANGFESGRTWAWSLRVPA